MFSKGQKKKAQLFWKTSRSSSQAVLSERTATSEVCCCLKDNLVLGKLSDPNIF